jgi:hypothetical protein
MDINSELPKGNHMFVIAQIKPLGELIGKYNYHSRKDLY